MSALAAPPVRRRLLRAVLGAIVLAACHASVALAQSPLRTIPGLTEIAIYESTSSRTRTAFLPASAALANRQTVLNNSNRDFSFTNGENYDVFYSDANGTPNLSGAFLTIEVTWTGPISDGSGNVTGAELVIGGQAYLANTVASFRLGSRCQPGACNANSVNLAVDGDLTFGTIPRMGATDANDPADRIRLTLGFPRPAGGSGLTLQPVAAVAPGERVSFTWNSTGAPSYTLGVVSGPGITSPLVIATSGCCSTSFVIPPSAPLGTFQIAVSDGTQVSQPVDVVIRFNFAPPVLSPIAPVAAGNILTFIWTPNPAILYDLVVLSGPLGGPFTVGQAACCVITLPIPSDGSVPPGTYTAKIVGAGIDSNIVTFQILGGTGGFQLSATSTVIRPGLQTTLSWNDRGPAGGPYSVFAGTAGAPSLALAISPQQCCVLTVPHSAVPPGLYDVYVQDANGVRTNRVTLRFDP